MLRVNSAAGQAFCRFMVGRLGMASGAESGSASTPLVFDIAGSGSGRKHVFVAVWHDNLTQVHRAACLIHDSTRLKASRCFRGVMTKQHRPGHQAMATLSLSASSCLTLVHRLRLAGGGRGAPRGVPAPAPAQQPTECDWRRGRWRRSRRQARQRPEAEDGQSCHGGRVGASSVCKNDGVSGCISGS